MCNQHANNWPCTPCHADCLKWDKNDAWCMHQGRQWSLIKWDVVGCNYYEDESGEQWTGSTTLSKSYPLQGIPGSGWQAWNATQQLSFPVPDSHQSGYQTWAFSKGAGKGWNPQKEAVLQIRHASCQLTAEERQDPPSELIYGWRSKHDTLLGQSKRKLN